MTIYARINPDTGAPDVRDFASPPSALKGWLLLTLVSAPTPGPNEVLKESVTFGVGIATQTWTLRSKTANELEAEELQAERAQIDTYLTDLNTQLDITNATRSTLTNVQRINELESDTRVAMKAVKFLLRQARRGF